MAGGAGPLDPVFVRGLLTQVDPAVVLEAVRDADGSILDFRYAAANPEACEFIPVTVSIGVTVTSPADDPATVFRRVDDAVYRAKDAGRNRIETADPTQDTHRP